MLNSVSKTKLQQNLREILKAIIIFIVAVTYLHCVLLQLLQ